MSQVDDQEVAAIRQWLDKQPHLPKDFDDHMLRKFLFSCHCSLEQTKQCLEKFCQYRRGLPEVFTARDPEAAPIRTALAITRVAHCPAGSDELLIHQLVETADFNFYDVMKSFCLQADTWLAHAAPRLPEGHVVIMDLRQISLMLVTKVNVFYLQKFIVFLLESMPLRLTQVHLVNCPSYYEYLYNLIKPALPAEIRKLIKFHPGVEGLHEYINKKYLPEEFGGAATSLQELHAAICRKLQDRRDYYANDELWKASDDGGCKTSAFENNIAIAGSFKTLSID